MLRAFSIVAAMLCLLAMPVSADLRSNPTWWDQNAVGSAPDWHYRVPVNVPAGAAVNSTVRVDVDFNALMEGKASIPGAWPVPFRLDGSARMGMIDIGDRHFVRAHADVDISELKA